MHVTINNRRCWHYSKCVCLSVKEAKSLCRVRGERGNAKKKGAMHNISSLNTTLLKPDIIVRSTIENGWPKYLGGEIS